MQEYWHIYARDADEQPFLCFLWRGRSQDGIERAQNEAVYFNRPDLHDFCAVRYDG